MNITPPITMTMNDHNNLSGRAVKPTDMPFCMEKENE